MSEDTTVDESGSENFSTTKRQDSTPPKPKSTFAQKWDDFMDGYWNPARTLSWDKTYNHNLWKKLQHTAYFFFGDLRFADGPERDKDNNAIPYQAGVLDYVPFFNIPKLLLEACFALWRLRERGELSEDQKTKLTAEAQHEKKAAETSYLAKARFTVKKFIEENPWVIYPLLLILGIVTLPLLIAQAVLALALTIAMSPIVVIVDIFAGPNIGEKSKVENDVIPITHARQSFWLNPSTWAMGAMLAFGINLLMQTVNPGIFGETAAYLGVIQGVFVGMAALLLVASAFAFVGEMIVAGYRYWQENQSEFESAAPASAPFHLSLLSYIQDRWKWMKNHWVITAVVGACITLPGLVYAVGLTVAVFNDVPADPFSTLLFNSMSNVLVSLIQAMSHLPGLEFLAASEAVLLPIAHILSAMFLIIAPLVIGDSALRFFYKRELVDNNRKVTELVEGSMVQNPARAGWIVEKKGPLSAEENLLPIDYTSVLSKTDPEGKVRKEVGAALTRCCHKPVNHEHVS